ncbi:MAG: T9SS type A sorting domain-containing protein, partial [Saprospiraceae bacterium]
EGGPWGEYIDFVCTDVHQTFFTELRFTDKGGNTNICGFDVILLDVIPPFCQDLPDFTGTCNEFHNEQFGPSTDTNEDYAFNDEEWVTLTDDLLIEYNNQFGNPNCEDNLACVSFTSEQQYQLIYAQCGVVEGRRRYRITDWNGQGLSSEWKYQNIYINYTPSWSFTLPVDFFGECGDEVPDADITIENGACDILAWEHEDQVFDLVPDACYEVIRTYHIINWCNYVQGQEPIELNRTENALGLVDDVRTISYEDVSNYGYYTYIQVLKIMDNVAPTLSINEVQTCIYGVGDANPAGVEDITPGAAPYECDTIRTFSVEASDCEKNDFQNFSFSYEIYEDNILVGNGEGNKFYWTVRPKVVYTIRFTVYDNCGNEGSLTKTYEFWDCTRPNVICIPEVNVEIKGDSTARIDATQFDKGSWDNCTSQSRLKYKIWHESLSLLPPNDKSSVASLPSTIYLECAYRGPQQIYYYVLDEEENYDFCVTTVIVNNRNGICTGDSLSTQAIVAGNIQTTTGMMVESVDIMVNRIGDMPTTTTTTGGDFSLNLNKGAAYNVIPVKTDEPLNGVTTFDLIVISKHILGLQKFTTPYEYIAADINNSGTVTAFDLVQLRQLILNITPDFPTNNSWRFVDATYAFTADMPLQEAYREAIEINNHQTDMMDADFVAIKIGDLNATATSNSLQQSEARTNRNKLTFKWADKALKAGETVTIDFTLADLQTIEGYQLALDFTGLELTNIQEGLVKYHHFGQHLLNRNILLSSWDQLSGFTESTTIHTHLFSLEFKAQTAGNLSEFLHLQPTITPTEAYHVTGEILDIILDFEPITTRFTLEQNRPNPFKEQTTIGFQLPDAGSVTLTILDVQGSVLLQETKDFAAGNQQWLIEGQSLTSKGVLYYQLVTDNELLTRKMMLLE